MNAKQEPRTVSVAVLILWIALSVGCISSIVGAGRMTIPVTPVVVYAILVFSFALMAFLVHKISRGRNWARITYSILFLLGMFSTIRSLVAIFGQAPASALFSGSVVLSQVIALALLFTRSSNAWFRQ